MAIAVVLPVAGQRMVTVLFGQHLIIRQPGYNVDESAFQRLSG